MTQFIFVKIYAPYDLPQQVIFFGNLRSRLVNYANEKTAITSMKVPPKVWECYVNDSFVIIKKESVSEFQDKLNSIDPMISFTIKKETITKFPS